MKKKLITRVVALLVCLFVITQALTGCAATLLSLVFYAGIPSLINQNTPDPDLEFVYEQKDYDQLLEKQSKLEDLLKDPDSASFNDLYNTFLDYLTNYMYMLDQYELSSILSYCYGADEEIDADYLLMDERYNAQYAKIGSYYLAIYESKHKDAFFSDWDEDSIRRMVTKGKSTDPRIEEINSANTELALKQTKLDTSSATFVADTYALYEQFVHNNRELASLYGYSNFYDYQADLSFSRDYSLEQMRAFTESAAKNVGPTMNELVIAYSGLMNSLTTIEEDQIRKLTEQSFYEADNAKKISSFLSWENPEIIDYYNRLGEWDCIFRGLEENEAQPAAFTVFLNWNGVPVLYFGPGYDDAFTFIHEFGHAFNMASTYDSEISLSLDLKEVMSQAHEMLFLAYLAPEFNTVPYRVLRLEKILNALQGIVLGSFVADFEYEVYMSEKELSIADYSKVIDELLADRYVGLADLFGRDVLESYICMVTMDAPCYYISYATSLMPCLELERIAHEDSLDKAEEIYFKMTTTGDKNFLALTEYVGLEDPLDAKTFESLCSYYKSWAQSNSK